MARRPGLPRIYFPTKSARVYWADFTVNGERHRVSTGTRDDEQADREAQRLYAEASLGRGPQARGRVRAPTSSSPLKLLVAEYIVWNRANGKASSYVDKQEMHFRAHFLPRWERLAHITSSSIEAYKVDRQQEKNGRGGVVTLTTVYKELVSLSMFLRWCKKKHHLAELPDFERFKPTTTYQPTNLTAADVKRLLAQLPDRATHHNRLPVREFFTVQWAQAMRPGEVMTLRWHDVDLERRRITIHPSNDKARTGRTIGMDPKAHAVLAKLARAPHLQTSRIFDRVDFRVSLRLAAGRAGLPKVTPHHLRHARISELASSTRDVAAVQFMAGHKNLSTTDRYVHSRTERTEEMLKVLNAVKGRRRTLPKSKPGKRASR